MPETIKNLSQTNLRIHHGPVTVGDVLYAPGGACGPRIQRDYQLVIIHRGALKLSLDDEEIQVPEKYGILLCPHHREHFIFSKDQETHHSWCAIRPEVVPRLMKKQFRMFRGPIPFVGRMTTLLDMGRVDSPGKSEDDPLQNGFYLGLGLALMCEFAATCRKGVGIGLAAEAILSRMEEFIRNECSRSLCLSEIARAAGVSSQHLLKLCRLQNRPTPIRQLYTKRLELSMDLLLHTGLAMSGIADRCGFANVFHFSRKFKQTYGQSPLAWRQQVWKNPVRFK